MGLTPTFLMIMVTFGKWLVILRYGRSIIVLDYRESVAKGTSYIRIFPFKKNTSRLDVTL